MNQAGWVALTALVAGMLLWPGSVPLARETGTEVVPEGRWLLQAGLAVDRQDRAITRKNEEGSLLEYLVPDDSVRAQLNGDVEREVQRMDLLLGYGLSDYWNLSLELPFYRITQSSTVTATGSDPDALLEAKRLQDRTLSGAGSLRLTSIHRTLYSDSQAFLWGFGLAVPAEDPESLYGGRGTLYLGSPFQEFFVWVHYDLFALTFPGRLSLHGEITASRDRTLRNLSGVPVSVNPGNQVLIRVAWEQEIGAWLTGLGLTHAAQSRSRINRALQGDRVVDDSLDFRLGYGNMKELERGAISFPYLIFIKIDRTFEGFNTPLRSEVQLALKTYF